MSVNQERWANIPIVSKGTEANIVKATQYPHESAQIAFATDTYVTYISRSQTGGDFVPIVGYAPYVAKTATYTITQYDYTVDCTANTFTVTLPTAVGIAGRVYVIKNSGAGVITVDGDGSETIDGATTQSLSTQYDSITVQSDGANWIIVSRI